MISKYYIEIKEQCSSCENREIRTTTRRFCKLTGESVSRDGWCPSWKLRKGLEEAGKSGGSVKPKAYLQYLAGVRDRENRFGLEERPTEDIRREYEEISRVKNAKNKKSKGNGK